MAAARPAAGPAHAVLQLLLRAPNATLPGLVLLGILDPADELVARQRRDVLPRVERLAVADQRHAQIRRKLVHHSAGHALAAHTTKIVGPGAHAATTCKRPPQPSPVPVGLDLEGVPATSDRTFSVSGPRQLTLRRAIVGARPFEDD